jgi:hypothetical protein
MLILDGDAYGAIFLWRGYVNVSLVHAEGLGKRVAIGVMRFMHEQGFIWAFW